MKQTTTMNQITVSPDAPVADNRQAFAEELIALASENPRVVAVCNDSVGSSNLNKFRELFPDRLINVGIAEQNMVGVGAGLANQGLLPFVCGAGPFLSGRATEQIKADVAYSQNNVFLCAMSPGMAYGELGPTHHSIEDISWMRALPGLDIVLPADAAATRLALRELVARPHPSYIRIGRFKVPDVGGDIVPWERGKSATLRDGSDATIFAMGTTVSRALWAAHELAEKDISVRVIDMRYVAPLDEAAILLAARETKGIVVAEEATNSGALGAAIAMIVGQSTTRVPLACHGVQGQFAPTGSNEFLLDYFGLGVNDLVNAVTEVIDRV